MDLSSASRPRTRRRGIYVAAIGAVVLLLSAAVVVWRVTHDGSEDLAADAVLTASSTEHGYSVRDAVTSGSASSPGATWQSAGETTGAWIELSWSENHEVRHVVLVRNPLEEPGITDGFLSFGDGSFLQVKLSTTSRETVVPVIPRSVDRLRFTVSGVSSGARHVAVAEIQVRSARDGSDVDFGETPDGNAAPVAEVTQAAGAADARALLDGSGAPGADGVGREWTVERPAGSWVQLDWERPRELSSVSVVGSSRSRAELQSATLTFGDGARLPVGAVLADPTQPTVISFMPRVTHSVRLTVDRAGAAGSLTLAELRAYERGVTPVRSPAATDPSPRPDPDACAAPTPGALQADLAVRCPTTGSTVGGTVILQVAATSGYSEITAIPWPADEAVPSGPVARATPDPSGAATLAVDLNGLPPGPLTVRVEATGRGKASRAVNFQLYRRGDTAATHVPSGTPAAGRTLAYAEEFDRPISVSHSGMGTDYAAAKPVHDGVQDFGDAIFADPAQDPGNLAVIDNHYLRIAVAPTPPGFVDPQGWSRTHLSGLLASARPGGSGFSAQYGYFEARMLVPAAPGTWPAFWMLPTDNLVYPTPVVAEIDTVELYGHDPKGACHSTHAHNSPTDKGEVNCGPRFATDRSAVSWHTYGASVTPTGITFYIDGQVVATAPQVEGGGAPMFFLVDLALGGGWAVDLQAVQDRAALYVDYVRVYV
jgi:hypothetical protein